MQKQNFGVGPGRNADFIVGYFEKAPHYGVPCAKKPHINLKIL